MIKRAFIIFAMTAVLLAVSVLGGACAAEAGQEPAARTILLWANGARSEDPFSHKIANRQRYPEIKIRRKKPAGREQAACLSATPPVPVPSA